MNFFLSLAGFLILLSTLPISAQEKPRAAKFDVISEVDAGNSEKLQAKLDKLKAALEKEPELTRAYIDTPYNSTLGRQINSYVESNLSLDNRIIFWGILRHPERYHVPSWGTEIYLIPQNAEIPYGCILEICLCPTLSVNSSVIPKKSHSVMTFVVDVQGGDIEDASYQWKISAGKIIEGQDTRAIKVNTTTAAEITATVEVGGLCDECPRKAARTIKIQR